MSYGSWNDLLMQSSSRLDAQLPSIPVKVLEGFEDIRPLSPDTERDLFRSCTNLVKSTRCQKSLVDPEVAAKAQLYRDMLRKKPVSELKRSSSRSPSIRSVRSVRSNRSSRQAITRVKSKMQTQKTPVTIYVPPRRQPSVKKNIVSQRAKSPQTLADEQPAPAKMERKKSVSALYMHFSEVVASYVRPSSPKSATHAGSNSTSPLTSPTTTTSRSRTQRNSGADAMDIELPGTSSGEVSTSISRSLSTKKSGDMKRSMSTRKSVSDFKRASEPITSVGKAVHDYVKPPPVPDVPPTLPMPDFEVVAAAKKSVELNRTLSHKKSQDLKRTGSQRKSVTKAISSYVKPPPLPVVGDLYNPEEENLTTFASLRKSTTPKPRARGLSNPTPYVPVKSKPAVLSSSAQYKPPFAVPVVESQSPPQSPKHTGGLRKHFSMFLKRTKTADQETF